MLTRQGWLLLLAAAATITVGRLFGILELFLLGAGVAALVVCALVRVRIAALRLEIGREVHPTRVYAGSIARVEVRATNQARRRSPALRLRDPVSGTRGALLHVSALRAGESARAAYRLPTATRGIVVVGPLTVEIVDPFGLAVLRAPAAPRTDLTVFPRLDDISPVGHSRGRDPHAGADHPNALGRQGEDFYALRPYVVGDDLRRVHWPSTARHDELMVRQEELPWQGRATVLLDVRRATHTAETLEAAVSAAASIVTACWRRRDLVRLVITDGLDSGFAAGHAHVEALMEYLATVETTGTGTLRSVVESLSRSGSGGALVAVMGRGGPGELEALGRLRHNFGTVTVVTFGTDPDGQAAARANRRGAHLISVEPGGSFAAAWEAAVRPGARGTTGAPAGISR